VDHALQGVWRYAVLTVTGITDNPVEDNVGKYVIMCGRWLAIAVLAVAYSLAADVLILCQARVVSDSGYTVCSSHSSGVFSG
jgi:hypothetical protein